MSMQGMVRWNIVFILSVGIENTTGNLQFSLMNQYDTLQRHATNIRSFGMNCHACTYFGFLLMIHFFSLLMTVIRKEACSPQNQRHHSTTIFMYMHWLVHLPVLSVFISSLCLTF